MRAVLRPGVLHTQGALRCVPTPGVQSWLDFEVARLRDAAAAAAREADPITEFFYKQARAWLWRLVHVNKIFFLVFGWWGCGGMGGWVGRCV